MPHRTRSLFSNHRAEHQLYTSNFASIKSLPPHITPVAISIGIPGWYKKERELRLAPTRAMLGLFKRLPFEEALAKYDPLYIDILAQSDPEEVYASLTHDGTRTVAMLCWCKRENVCHRRYAAEWFEAHLGIVVPEYGVPRSQTETYWEWEDSDDEPGFIPALSVRQPAASAIMYPKRGRKNIENRSWQTSYRGPLVIHAGSSRADMAAIDEFASRGVRFREPLSFGAILGVVDLVDCVERGSSQGRGLRRDNPWAHRDAAFYWLVERPRLLPKPIQWRGSLGLFRITDRMLLDAIGETA